jgi:hypothetical protein
MAGQAESLKNIGLSDLFSFFIHKDCSSLLGCFYLQLGDLAVSSMSQ